MEPETLNMLLAVFCFCFFCACACVCILGVSLILKYGLFGLLDSVEPLHIVLIYLSMNRFHKVVVISNEPAKLRGKIVSSGAG